MEKKQWVKPELRLISRAEYWEMLYRDYEALRQDHRIDCPCSSDIHR